MRGIGRRVRRRQVVLCVVGAMVFAGCGHHHQPEVTAQQRIQKQAAQRAAAVRRLPALKRLWTAPVGVDWQPAQTDRFGYRPQGDLTTWTTGSVVVVAGSRSVAAYDATSGRRSWVYHPPAHYGTFCGAAPTAPGGVAGLLVQRGGKCRAALALSLDTGRARWIRPLPTAGVADGSVGPVTVTAHTMTVQTLCAGAPRLDLRTGRLLADPAAEPGSEGCPNSVAVGDGVIAVTPRTGSGRGQLTVYDADSGRRRWENSSLPAGSSVYSVVSGHPLILQLEQGATYVLETFSRRGRSHAYVGRSFHNAFPSVIGVRDGTLAVGFALRTAFTTAVSASGFSLAGNRTRWRRTVTQTPVAGLQGGAVLTARLLTGADDRTTLLYGRADFADPAHETVLGTVRLPTGSTYLDAHLGWTDDLLLVVVAGELQAYRLPADGPAMPADVAAPAAPSAVGHRPWTSTDVRPDDVGDPCARLRPATLRALGFGSVASLPPPDDCRWLRDSEDVMRSLSVQVGAIAPGAHASAAAEAHARLAGLRTGQHDGTPRAIDGPGDEAWVAQRIAKASGRRYAPETHVAVRRGNVVVVVDATLRAFGDTARLPTPARSRALVRRVVGEIVSTVGTH